MRDHDTCEPAINAALARGDDGRAEFLAARCDIEHGEQAAQTEGVGTGAGEGATGQDTGTAWVTRSEDCSEAPAQAHPLAHGEQAAAVATIEGGTDE